MKLSERDKKLLMILVAIAVVAIAFFFGYRPLTEKRDKLQTEIDELNVRYTSLQTIAQNEKKHVADKEANNKEYDEIMAKYGDNLAQESILMYLRNYEYDSTIWFKAYSMPKAQKLHTFSSVSATGYKNSLALTFESSYSDMKKLLKDIVENPKKNYISAYNMTYNAVDDKVTATMTLERFTVVKKDTPTTEQIKLENVLLGHDNIFTSVIFKPGSSLIEDEGNRILNDNDFQLVVNPVGASDATVTLNKSDDREGTSKLTTDYNGVSDVSITIAEDEGGLLKATYKIGASEKSITFIPGENLDLLICSTPRITNDLVAINLTVKNKSKMVFNIKVINDDEESPRIRLANQEGSVRVIND